ncbi:polyprotein [Nilaparvata lugens honeydew virus-2]|uniref:polyprotein n=1 Tax=Nilaparvata lugens honeydew virus-2 TaxID=1345661 RepID=UPI0003508327|nr:polyprotein [Nilaparvata lugens honeydew virus-2]BAN57352.1 polyprotein [Nilaparvata lugens honeydew virus-2]
MNSYNKESLLVVPENSPLPYNVAIADSFYVPEPYWARVPKLPVDYQVDFPVDNRPSQVVKRVRSSFDERIRIIKHKLELQAHVLNRTPPKGSAYFDPKNLPWADRFRHWALKTYKYKSNLYKSDFARMFRNRNIIITTLLELQTAERRHDARRNAQLRAKRDYKAWCARMRKSYVLLAPEDSDEDVPSYPDEGPSPPPPPPRKKSVDEDWYDPQGFNHGPIDNRPLRRKWWKKEWQNIAKMLSAKKSGDDYYRPELYVHTTEPLMEKWASLRYALKPLDTPPPENKNSSSMVQADTARTFEVEAECSEKGNTIFIEQSGKSVGTTSASVSRKMQSIIPDQARFSSLSDREIVLETFKWKNESANTKLKEYSLPAALIKLRKQNPTAVPFQIHTFATCDFIIRVRTNANPFQIGQLQCSWLYDPEADVNLARRLNIWSLSQTNHCLVNAGSSNIGEIHVQYINPYTTLPAFKSEMSDNSFNLGKFYIFVLNQLTCPDAISKECSVTVSIELINATYMGSRDMGLGDFTYPQSGIGAAIAVAAAEKLLESTNTPNNDKPPYQGSRMAMVPQSNQSFCLGTNLTEPINSLRLDASGQHKSVINGPNEMTVSHISNIYGLINTEIWNTDHHTGQRLLSYDASPLFNKSFYFRQTAGTDETYVLPPVAVLSSLYAYWSGELRMRVDFVASRFHTGRLLICYVPLYLQDITLDQAYSYPYQMFDLREGNQSFTFNIPYMSMVPMYPRRSGYTTVNDQYAPPGRVHVFVVNELIAMDNVSKDVMMNVYWAAGDNFNVFVPAQPSLVTSFFPDNATPTTNVQADEGTYPWYMGYDVEMVDGGVVPAICRYSAFPDRITTFRNTKFGHYYTMNKPSNHYATMGDFNPNGGDPLNIKNYYYKDLFFVPIYNIALEDFVRFKGKVFGVCKGLDQVKQYYADIGTEADPKVKCLQNLLVIQRTATSGYVDGNPVFTGKQVPEADFEVVARVQMDERVVGGPDEEVFAACKVYPVAASLNKDLLGEKFGDLKTLCRRYQPYGVTKVTTSETYGDVQCTFPATPTGLDIDIKNVMSNYPRYVREGPLQVVMSGFRFYSGGMRFAIATSNDQFSLWVQHRPDYEGELKINTISNKKTASNLINSGYAQYLQSLKVNNIVTFEVPYYKNRNCLYAQRVKKLKRTANTATLGQVVLGIEGKKKDDKLAMTIFASVADDFQAYVFQGFPPMIYVDDLQVDVTQSITRTQMFSMKHEHTHKVSEQVLDTFDYMEESVKGTVDSSIAKLDKLIEDKINRLDNAVSTNLKSISGALKDVKPCIENFSSATKGALMDVIGHLGHCIISPTKSNICWAVVQSLLKYGILTTSNVTEYADKLLSPISRIFRDTPHTTPNELVDAGVQAKDPHDIRLLDKIVKMGPKTFLESYETMEDAAVDVVSILFSLISGLYGVKKCDYSWFDPRYYGKVMVEGLPTASRNYRFIIVFFQKLHELIKKIIEAITYYLNPKLMFGKMVVDDLPLLTEWHENVQKLIDPANEQYIMAKDSIWAPSVEEAYVMGLYIQKCYTSYLDGNSDDILKLKESHVLFSQAFSKLCLIRNDMYKRGNSAVQRREPFCIWMAGTPGIGKSQLSGRLTYILLKHLGVQWRGPHTYVVQSGVDYWNGIGQEPCILIDDFLAVESGQMKDIALTDFMKINSPSCLNPNMAAIPDKNIRIAPEIFYINCNRTYPKVAGTDHVALWRRRDILVEAVLAPFITDAGFTMVKGNEDEIEAMMAPHYMSFANFDHLNFKVHKNILDPNGATTQLLTYNQFLNLIKLEITKYHKRQVDLFKLAKQEIDETYVGKEMPQSLSALKKEHKKAMEYLQTYGPAPGVTMSEFFQIMKMVSQKKPLTEEQRRKIVELTYGSKKYQEELKEGKHKDLPRKAPEPLILVKETPKEIEKKKVKPLDSETAGPSKRPTLTEIIFGAKVEATSGLTEGETAEYLTSMVEENQELIKKVLKEKQEKIDKASEKPPKPPNTILSEVKVEDQKTRPDPDAEDPDKIEEVQVDPDPVRVQCPLFPDHDHCPLFETPRFEWGDWIFCNEKRIAEYDIEELSDILKNLLCTVGPVFSKVLHKGAWEVKYNPKSAVDQKKLRTYILAYLIHNDAYFDVLNKIEHTEKKNMTKTATMEFNYNHKLFEDKIMNTYFKVVVKVIYKDMPSGVEKVDRMEIEELKCVHNTDILLCKNKACLAPFADSFIDLGCECHMLASDSFWCRDKEAFINSSHKPINPWKCTNKDCRWTKAYANKWAQYNRQSIVIGNIPPEMAADGKRDWLHYIKNCASISIDILGRCILGAINSPALCLLYLFIYYAVPWLTFLAVSWRVLNWLFPTPGTANMNDLARVPKDVFAEMHSSGDVRAAQSRFRAIKPTFRSVTKLQAATVDLNDNTQQVIKKIRRNTYFLKSDSVEEITTFKGFRVFFLYANIIVFQRHYYEYLQRHEYFLKTNDWYLENEKYKVKIYVDPSKWVPELPKLNQIGYCKVPEAPRHRSLLKNIASASAQDKSMGYCLIVSVHEDDCLLLPVRPTKTSHVKVSTGLDIPDYQTDVVYSYPWSAPGNCCSLLLNPKLQAPIIGVHFAGNSMEGYSEPISNCMYADWIEQHIEEHERPEIIDANTVPFDGNFIPLGFMHPDFAKRESGISVEMPSLVADKYFPVTTAPAPLKKNDPRMPPGYSPLYAGVSNMGKPPKSFCQGPIDDYVDALTNKMIAYAEPLVDCQVRSFEEAIVGLPGIKHFEGVDMQTSEGFPFSRFRPAGIGNKSWLFNIERGEDGFNKVTSIHKDLMELMNKQISERASGTKCLTIFEDCLKDSRLPHTKVLIPGKTRIISTSPIQFTIVFKAYFMDFMAAYMQARLKLDHAIGIVPDGPEWGNLVSKMHFSNGESKNQNFLSGDYKNFGPTLSMQVMEAACTVILNWCKHYYGYETEAQKKNQRVRAKLLLEIINSVHLCYNSVYMPLCGAPSGSPITVILNELCNEIYMYSAFVYLGDKHYRGNYSFKSLKPHNHATVDFYDYHVRKCGYGDDIILNISDTCKEYFNHQTISQFFLAHGIGYTTATKDDALGAFSPSMCSITFLKRGFEPHPKIPGQWLAPLDMDVSVKEVINWMSKKLDPIEATAVNIEACAMNAYGHGPIEHAKIREICNKALHEIKSPRTLRTWEQLDHIHFFGFHYKLLDNPMIDKILPVTHMDWRFVKVEMPVVIDHQNFDKQMTTTLAQSVFAKLCKLNKGWDALD